MHMMLFYTVLAAISVTAWATTNADQVNDIHINTAQDNSKPKPIPVPQPSFEYERGSPELCPQANMNRMQALPGYGWDNLQNKEMATIFDPQYTKCRATTDRKFLIPDGLQVYPQKRSDVQVYSSLIEKFSDFKSSTSNSLNIDAGLSFHVVSVSASFSREYQSTKEHMVKDRSATTRAECRYVMYNIQNEPDAPLSPSLQKRLYELASAIQSNHTETVRYLADLLVRDFGTHVVNKVDVGAAVVKEDQIRNHYVLDHDTRKSTITAAASASFLGIFSVSTKYSTSTSKDQLTTYENNRTHSEVFSHGGPPIGANLSLAQWLKDIDNNLVTVDRSGDPLWFLVSPTTLPELPVDTVRDLAQVVQEAVLSYYQHNSYRGCTSIDSPNFSYMANIDDGTCKGPDSNYTFGGIYQSCTGGECSASYMQKNPMTGTYSCPSGYKPTLLYQRRTVHCHRECHHFLFVTYGCHDNCGDQYTADYKAYWCVDTEKKIAANSGYMFGGVFTDKIKNPLTQSNSCPVNFNALKFGTNPQMSVCVSDDYELGFRYSLPFAGFFTCDTGNPLALSSEPLVKLMQATRVGSNQPVKLSSFMYQEGPKNWPKTCPVGYSQHLLTMTDSGCAVHYCVKAGFFSNTSLPSIRRPPFSIKPEVLTNATRLLATSSGKVLSRSGDATTWSEVESWSALASAQTFQPERNLKAADDKKEQEKGLSNTSTAIISVLGTAVGGLVLIMAVIGFQKYRKRKRDALVPWGERTRGYGQIGGEDNPNTRV